MQNTQLEAKYFSCIYFSFKSDFLIFKPNIQLSFLSKIHRCHVEMGALVIPILLRLAGMKIYIEMCRKLCENRFRQGINYGNSHNLSDIQIILLSLLQIYFFNFLFYCILITHCHSQSISIVEITLIIDLIKHFLVFLIQTFICKLTSLIFQKHSTSFVISFILIISECLHRVLNIKIEIVL